MKYEDVDPTEEIRLDFDENNPNYQDETQWNIEFLKIVKNQMYDRMNAQGYLFLNEVLARLDFKRLPEGQLVGWEADHDYPVLWEVIDAPAGLVIVFKPQGFIWDKI